MLPHVLTLRNMGAPQGRRHACSDVQAMGSATSKRWRWVGDAIWTCAKQENETPRVNAGARRLNAYTTLMKEANGNTCAYMIFRYLPSSNTDMLNINATAAWMRRWSPPRPARLNSQSERASPGFSLQYRLHSLSSIFGKNGTTLVHETA